MIEYKRLPSNAELLKFAKYLEDVHVGHQPERRFVDDRDFLGGLGERQYAYVTGEDMDTRRLGGAGDGGKDNVARFKTGEVHPVNVKIARFPKELIVAVRDMKKITKPTIFILGRLLHWGTKEHPTDPLTWDAELLRWAWDWELRESIPKYHTKDCVLLNYWRAFDDCHDIYELLALIERRWGRGA